MECKAIITGDIVRSSILEGKRRKALYDTFPLLSALLKKQYPYIVSYDISNFRGDGWQLVIDQPEKALEVSMFIRTYIRFKFREEKLDTRFAIGIGSTSFIPPENISAGDGSAYVLSGHLLETLSENNMAIGFEKNDQNLNVQWIKNTLLLIDHIVSAWSSSQCQAIFWALHGYRQSEIAINWYPAAITQATVSYNLKSAGWKKIKATLCLFEMATASLIQE